VRKYCVFLFRFVDAVVDESAKTRFGEEAGKQGGGLFLRREAILNLLVDSSRPE